MELKHGKKFSLKRFMLVFVSLFIITICFVVPSSVVFGNKSTDSSVMLVPENLNRISSNQSGNVVGYGSIFNDEKKETRLYQLMISKDANFSFKAFTIKDIYNSTWDGDRLFFTSRDLANLSLFSSQKKKINWSKIWEDPWTSRDKFIPTNDKNDGLSVYIDYGRNGISLTHFNPTGNINFSGKYEIQDKTNEKFLPTSYVANFSFNNEIISDQHGNCYVIGNVFKISETSILSRKPYPFVCKISPTGVPLWCKMFLNPNSQKQEIEKWVVSAYLENDKLLLIGCNEPAFSYTQNSLEYPKINWFASIDSDGKILWKKEYEFTMDFFPNELIKDKENNYWITGQFYQRNGSLGGIYGSYPALIEMSSDGKIEMTKIYGKQLTYVSEDFEAENITPDSFGSFNQVTIDKENNKYVTASILDFPFLCKLDQQGESSVLSSKHMKVSLKQSVDVSNSNWESAKFIWEPIDLKLIPDNKAVSFPDFIEEPFKSYYLAKDAGENLVIRTDQVDIPLDSLRNILIAGNKNSVSGYSYADIQEGIQQYIKQENSYRQEMERRKQEFMKEEWKFQIKLLVVYTSLILLLSCLFFWINRKFGRKQEKKGSNI